MALRPFSLSNDYSTQLNHDILAQPTPISVGILVWLPSCQLNEALPILLDHFVKW